MTLPTLDELLALRGSARKLSLRAGGPARGLLAGGHHSVHRGRGLEFQEVRPYVAGDDPRSIDWRVTARRGKPHTKLFREERERPVWLVADLRANLFFGSRRQLKSAVVVRGAALLAWAGALAGDRVGAVLAGASGHRVLPPRSREAGVLPILTALIDTQPTAPGDSSSPGFGDALRALAPLVRPGSVVLALSDFSEPEPSDGAPWPALAAHNECRLFWVTDALEEQGLPNGRFRVGLPGRLRVIDGAEVRGRWLESWRARQARIEALGQRIGVPIIRLDTSEPVEDTLRATLRGGEIAA